MPIYEYRCERGHTFEVLQRMTDDPVTACATCDARVQRVLHPVAVHFKGSGFYSTDYGKKGRGSTTDSGDSAEAKKNGSGSGDAASKGESKSEASKSGSDKTGSSD